MGISASWPHGPLRAVAALADVLVAVVLGGLAWWCWQRGVIMSVHEGVQVSRIEGAWWAGATAAATLAGILLLDALRQVVPTRVPR
ncbi:MAG: hypothetical protein ACRDTE_01025 [Pseudonocardiaceae bacterium]